MRKRHICIALMFEVSLCCNKQGLWTVCVFDLGREVASCVSVKSVSPPGLWHSQPCTTELPFICETKRVGFTLPPPGQQTTVSNRCPSYYTEYNGYCYRVNSQGVTLRIACTLPVFSRIFMHSCKFVLSEFTIIESTSSSTLMLFLVKILMYMYISTDDRKPCLLLKWLLLKCKSVM